MNGRLASLLALLIAAALGFGAGRTLGAEEEPTPTTTTTTTSTTLPVVEGPVSPISGLPVADEAALDRRALLALPPEGRGDG